MFWKKDKSPIFVELNTDNVRQAYRVTPGPDSPTALVVDDRRARILNISSAGIAFAFADSPNPLPDAGEQLSAVLILETGAPVIPVEVEIIDRQGERFRGRLTPSTEQAQKALCQYLIDQQKQEIRRRAGESADESGPAREEKDREE